MHQLELHPRFPNAELRAQSEDLGLLTMAYASLGSPERSAELYLADERVTEASPAARDEAMAGRLWELSLGMVGLRPEELAEPIRA